jgi:hypothetical protein
VLFREKEEEKDRLKIQRRIDQKNSFKNSNRKIIPAPTLDNDINISSDMSIGSRSNRSGRRARQNQEINSTNTIVSERTITRLSPVKTDSSIVIANGGMEDLDHVDQQWRVVMNFERFDPDRLNIS